MDYIARIPTMCEVYQRIEWAKVGEKVGKGGQLNNPITTLGGTHDE